VLPAGVEEEVQVHEGPERAVPPEEERGEGRGQGEARQGGRGGAEAVRLVPGAEEPPGERDRHPREHEQQLLREQDGGGEQRAAQAQPGRGRCRAARGHALEAGGQRGQEEPQRGHVGPHLERLAEEDRGVAQQHRGAPAGDRPPPAPAQPERERQDHGREGHHEAARLEDGGPGLAHGFLVQQPQHGAQQVVEAGGVVLEEVAVGHLALGHQPGGVQVLELVGVEAAHPEQGDARGQGHGHHGRAESGQRRGQALAVPRAHGAGRVSCIRSSGARPPLRASRAS
jgi:hypothetical protein